LEPPAAFADFGASKRGQGRGGKWRGESEMSPEVGETALGEVKGIRIEPRRHAGGRKKKGQPGTVDLFYD
jgi:hypothetical protein